MLSDRPSKPTDTVYIQRVLQAVTGAMFNLFEQGLRQLEQKEAVFKRTEF
jgi:hypothetical protein